jgi:hypothetical protein
MHAVLAGQRTWREAGSDASELLLRALGIPPTEARDIARAELPPLAEAARHATGREKRKASK